MMGKYTVSPDNFPHTFEALDTLSHDCGGRCHPSYEIPDTWLDKLPAIESGLSTLTEDERITFSCGDEDDMAQIALRSDGLALAHRLLNDWFDDFPDAPDAPDR